MTSQTRLLDEMITYYQGDAKRIGHFMKVYLFAGMIGEQEGLEQEVQFVLETAAIVHDIGIKASEEKYQSSAGNYQELEGPAVAKPMLERLGYEKKVIDRVLYLIAHHHTYTDVDGLDYQILLEADFLVNAYEDGLRKETIEYGMNKIFQTESGKKLCKKIYQISYTI